jgi:hypothetical protein
MAIASRLSAAPPPRVSAPAPTTAPSFARAPSTSASPTSAAPALRLAPGKPLSPTTRRKLEQTFRADLGRVRVQKNAAAAQRLGTPAFALGSDVVLGHQAQEDDLGLMAHEVAHTLQQSGSRRIQRYSRSGGDSLESEARQASSAATQGQTFTVTGHTDGARPQGLFGISSPLDFIADKANLIPGFRMFTILLGVNPVNMSRVERSAANVLRAMIEFIPGGGLITQALDNNGVFEKVAQWVDTQVQTLGLSAASIKKSVTEFIDSLGLSDLGDLSGAWERAKRIFSEPIDRIITFAKNLASGILKFIKDAILIPIAKLATGTPGYDLLKAVMGKDPVTDEPVERTAENIIGPFMKLIGEEEVWENMKKANAISRAWAWAQGALAELKGFVAQIPGLFIAAFESLVLADIILVPRAFAKIVGVFGSFLVKFITWGGNAVWKLLEIVFDCVSPDAWGYIKKTGAALKSILKNPLPFVGNLVNAAKLGFQNFGSHFLDHLKNGLINWLLGALPGVYIPKAFALGEIVKFVFSVLGLTWAQFRQKLVKATSETVVAAMETAVDIVVVLVRDGPAAAWERIKDELVKLKDMVIGGITDFIVDTVVKKAVPKLISMFIPGAGFITAILAIYDTVMVFVNKIAQIIRVVKGFIDSIVAIAGGAIDAAAAKVEGILAGLLSLAINFLAGFVGLGKVADKIMGVINKVRATIDKALDKLVDIVVTAAKKLWGKAKSAVSNWWKAKKEFSTPSGEKHTLLLQGEGANAKLIMKSDPILYKDFIATLIEPTGAKGKKVVASKIAEELDLAIKDAAKNTATPSTKPTPPDPKNDPADKIQKIFDRLAEATAPLLATDSKVALLAPPKTISLGGSTVAVGMSIDWLGPDYPHGTPPASGAQSALMGLLVTEPKKGRRSKEKYIRGHLLNENLGGLGNDKNLFPITGNANSKHLHSTETTIKTWHKEQKKKWVFYKVDVQNISQKLDLKKKEDPSNYVNCVFACHAILKDGTGKTEKEFTTNITSTFDAESEVEKKQLVGTE